MVRIALIAPTFAIALTGCGSLSSFNPNGDTAEADDTGVVIDTDQPPGSAPSITEITPRFGSTVGGTAVQLTGSGFDQSVQVRIGGKPATIQSVTPTQMTVISPNANGPGAVDVVADRAGQIFSWGGGFQYFDDAQGGAGVMGEIGWAHYAGAAWADTVVDQGHALLYFVEPRPAHYWDDYTDSFASCRANYSSADPSFITTGGSVQLRSGGGTFNVPQYASGAPEYLVTGLPQPYTGPGSNVTLAAVTPGIELPGISVENFALVPQPFQVTVPDLDAASIPAVTRSINIKWSGGQAGDYIVVRLERQYDQSGTWVTDQYITCAGPDVGQLSIPAALWNDWYQGDHIFLDVGRVYERGANLPHNNAANAVAGIYWNYGVVRTIN